jgi:hypothetical protein
LIADLRVLTGKNCNHLVKKEMEMTNNNEVFTLSSEEFADLLRGKSNNRIEPNDFKTSVIICDSDGNEIQVSPEEFDNLFTITKAHNCKISIVMGESEIPDNLQKIINHLAASSREHFSPELVEKNEILMIAPEEHDKQRLRAEEYLEKTIQGTTNVFANSELLRMDLFAGLDVELELVVKHSTGSRVLNYVISKDEVLKKKTTAVTSVTLDTNVVVEYLEKRSKVAVVESLLELAQSGLLDLCVTGRIREDIPRQPLSERINGLPELGIREMGSIIRTGHWKPGRDSAGSTMFQEAIDSLPDDTSRPRKKRPDWRDWDHVQTHYLNGRDVFLTWDKGILNAAPHLKEKLGIVIMKPEDYLQHCKKQIEPRSSG